MPKARGRSPTTSILELPGRSDVCAAWRRRACSALPIFWPRSSRTARCCRLRRLHFAGRSATTYKDSVASPIPPVTAPAGAPNVLLVLLDDEGYGQSGTFGGLIPTPTLDRLAAGGLRYTRFHVTALCSPTRAALLTGRNNHAVGVGIITNFATDFPGYTGSIPKSAALVSEVLRENGYATAAFGKWHLIPENELLASGPYDHWPTHQGFDHYYGYLNGETDQWHPELTLDTQPVEMQPPPGRRADYTLNEDLADKAIEWLRAEKSLAPTSRSSCTTRRGQATSRCRRRRRGSTNSRASSTWVGTAIARSCLNARRSSAWCRRIRS